MKQETGFKDEIMNFFKLKLSNWNINDAIKYYKYDKFCLDYCIAQNYQYGCRKNHCQYQHSISLEDLVFGSSQQKRDLEYKKAEFLCLYFMHKKMYNDNNPALFNAYALILYMTGKSRQDYLKSEKYFLKSLTIDNTYHSAHNSYGVLLEEKLENYDKAEYHYNQALIINPNNAMGHAHFAYFLIFKRQKYEFALFHSQKACKFKPNLSWHTM